MIQYLGIVLPALIAFPISDEERSHGLRIAVGAGLDPALHARLEERFRIPILEVLGMTGVAIASMASVEPRRIETRSIGRPLKDLEFRVADEADSPVPAGTSGELLLRVKGPDPRRGLVGKYLDNEKATEEA